VLSGCSAYNRGGGAVCSNGGTLNNCTFSGNSVTGSGNGGGGVYCSGAGGAVNNCTITGNQARNWGGGAFCNSGGTLNNCTISGNTADSGGGGVFLWSGGTLNNCTLSGNTAAHSGKGGGAYCNTGGALNNCTLSGNTAASSSGVYAYGGGVLVNCIVSGNSPGGTQNIGGTSGYTIQYTCSPGLSGSGNLTNDPQFVSAPAGNYRLLAGSPCINTGTNQAWMTGKTDLDGNPRIIAGTVDMGAYETVVPPGNALSFNGTSQSANIGHGTSLDVGNTLTVEAWIKPINVTNRYGIFSTRFINTAGAFQLEVGLGSGSIGTDRGRVAVSGSGTWVAQATNDVIRSNVWTHIAYTRSGMGAGTHALYVNGVAQALISNDPYTFTNNTSDKVIGSGTGGTQFFPGQIDELRVWNVARTEAEIRDAMHKQLAGSETGLVAYYNFNINSGTLLPDMTANANNGTLMNSPVWTNSTIPCANAIADRTNIRGVWLTQTNGLASSRFSVTNAVASGTNFVVFGHDNATDAWQTADVPGTPNSRLTRVWRAEVSGSATGAIKVDTTGLSAFGDGSTLRLLVDVDGTFASGATIVTGIYSAPYFIVAGQSIANGSYYTLGANRSFYAVTYNANGATSGTVPDGQMKIQGVNLTLASNTGSLSKTNCLLASWNTAANGSGTSYAVGATYSTDAALTLYAQWEMRPSNITAVDVYGQLGSFTTGTANKEGVSADSLNGPAGVVLDSSGNVYVADSVNNRVLYYPAGSATATRVYGQGGSFTTGDANHNGISPDSLSGPQAVALDSSGNLYVTDSGNHRVLYYPAGSTTATRVYGQDDFTGNAANKGGGVSSTSLNAPAGLVLDSSGNLYVADVYNNRVLRYPAGITTADRVYGQGGVFTTGDANKDGISANSLRYPMGVALDVSGGLVVADLLNNRVLGYPAGGTTATVVYGQGGSFATGTANKGGLSADSLSMPFAVVVDGGGNLYVADMNNNRVLYYLAGSTTALRVYGQGCVFTTGTANKGGISANSLRAPAALALDSNGNLHVADQQNHRVLKYDPTLPQAYTVTYDGNGSTGGTTPVDGGSPYLSGILVTVLSNTFTKAGYNFAGWLAAADGSGTVYGDTFVMGSSNTTLYAKWTTLPIYTVTYNANGATSGTAPGTQIKEQGASLTLAANSGALAKIGSPFAGWNTAADGTGTNYAASATYSTDAALTLYAKWRYAVTAAAGANGSLDAATPSPQSVSYNGTTSFKFNADAGYYVESVSGCGISYVNTNGAIATYTATTGVVTADGTVTATFATHTLTDIGAALTGINDGCVAWGDYNNDGFLDVLITGDSGYNYVSQLYRNNGNGTFTDSGVVLSGVTHGSVAWGDYDNDGFLDILLAGQDGVDVNVTKLYHNNGNGTFTEQTGAGFPGVADGCVAWGDYDNDGYPDIILTGELPNYGPPISKIFHNNGNGTFSELAGLSLPQVDQSSAAWGDYNNDGYLDFVLAGRYHSSDAYYARIYRNNGDSTFTDTGNSLAQMGFSHASSAWADYDNDGFLDLVITGGEGVTAVYHNDGNGTFTEQAGLPMPALWGSTAAWGDYDNDGFNDLLLTGQNENDPFTKAYRNNGNGTFSVETSVSLPQVEYSSCAWGDYNNDGRLDILLAGARYVESPDPEDGTDYERITKIYRSGVVHINQTAAAPTNLTAVVSGATVTLSWNKTADLETSQNGLTYNVRVGTAPGKDDVMSGMAHTTSGLRRIPALGNVNMNHSWKLTLPRGGTNYWSVQAVDTALAGGAWATEGSFYIRAWPSVTTDPVTGITTTTAQGGGNVASTGDSSVIAKGLVWSTNGNPTVTNYLGKTDHGAGTGSFADTLTGLSGGQTYTVRAYATSSLGTSYGSPRIFTPLMPQFAKALAFDGRDDYVLIADTSDLDLTSTYTLECWFKADSFGSGGGALNLHGLIGKYQTASANGYFLRMNLNELDFDQMVTSGLNLESNRWYHVAAVNSNGTRRLYVNGVEKALTGSAITVAANANELRLASDFGGRYFPGQMDEARVWNVARSQADIQASMNKELTGSESGLVAYYTFNHISGLDLFDVTGKGHDGILENGPAWVTSTCPLGWILTASAGVHGTISPAGPIMVLAGGSTNFVITPDTYYHVADVTTNGMSVGAVAVFTWTNVIADGTINASFAADLAAQGTPNWWLAQYGLTNGGWTFNQAETNKSDSDAFDNGQEYVADTNPTNPASYFRITAISNSPAMTVSFVSSASRAYTLIGVSNLSSGVWSPVPGAGPRLGIGGQDSLSDTNVPPKGPFYKLRVELP
jgi:uncharacterized repeat protein (TIGR02543 family)